MIASEGNEFLKTNWDQVIIHHLQTKILNKKKKC